MGAIAFPAADPSGGTGDTISTNVRVLMTTRGVSQVRLAEVLNLSQTAVSRRLRGLTAWDTDDLDALSQAFGVGVAELVLPQPTMASEPSALDRLSTAEQRTVRTHPRRRDQGGRVNASYPWTRVSRVPHVTRTSRDEWRIRHLPGSHDLPILLRRHAGNHQRCQRVAA